MRQQVGYIIPAESFNSVLVIIIVLVCYKSADKMLIIENIGIVKLHMHGFPVIVIVVIPYAGIGICLECADNEIRSVFLPCVAGSQI